MKTEIIEVADGFWNIRGSFKVGGVVDVKTHVSLVRLGSGHFVFLDSYSLDRDTRSRISDIVGSDGTIEAILNVHPFHTVHVEKMHEMYPEARLYGTARHLERFPDLPWEAERTEDSDLHALYADDFDFSVPAGVDFIPANENIHFSSVLVMHRATRTIHVDDTFMYVRFPGVLRRFGIQGSLGFHPTLSSALEKREGAAAEFRGWAEDLIEDWGDAENLCAAHMAPLLAADNRGASIAARLQKALKKSASSLYIHRRRYG
jgi:hypothetical protein